MIHAGGLVGAITRTLAAQEVDVDRVGNVEVDAQDVRKKIRVLSSES
jgi:hypothetical protein